MNLQWFEPKTKNLGLDIIVEKSGIEFFELFETDLHIYLENFNKDKESKQVRIGSYETIEYLVGSLKKDDLMPSCVHTYHKLQEDIIYIGFHPKLYDNLAIEIINPNRIVNTTPKEAFEAPHPKGMGIHAIALA